VRDELSRIVECTYQCFRIVHCVFGFAAVGPFVGGGTHLD
jgi:hypothetical protein